MDKIVKKHKALLADYENQKRKKLEKLGTKMLKKMELFDKLKEKINEKKQT